MVEVIAYLGDTTPRQHMPILEMNDAHQREVYEAAPANWSPIINKNFSVYRSYGFSDKA